MESKYTTNKGILPDELITEMKAAFMRSESLLDLEMQPRQTGQQAETSTQQPDQMVVSLDHAEEMMSQGWRFVATLPQNRAVVEKIGVRKELV